MKHRGWRSTASAWRVIAVAALVGACKDSATDSARLPLGPAKAAQASGSLGIPDDAPEYVANLEASAVLADFETGVPGLGHRFAVPKSWGFVEKKVLASAKPFEARVLSLSTRDPKPDAPSLAVAVREAPFEVPVDALSRHVLAGEGWEIQRARWVPGRSGLYFDVVALKDSGGEPWVRRLTARAAAGQIVEMNALARRSDWDSVKEAFWAAGATLELHQGATETRLEGWRRYSGRSPDFELAYPESWQPEAASPSAPSTSAVNLRLLSPSGTALLAYLQVSARAPSEGAANPTDERLAAALEALARQNIQPKQPPRRLADAEDPRSLAVAGWLGTFVAPVQTPDGGAAQVRVGFLETSQAQFQLVGLSPTLVDDPIAALRSQRAFEIVRETLRGAPSDG